MRSYLSYRRGKYAETLLIKQLRKQGFWATRLPRSGKSYFVDVIGIRKGKVILAEVKRRRTARDIYIEKWKYERMRRIMDVTGATFLLILYIQSLNLWLARRIDDYDKMTEKHVVYKINDKWRSLDSFLS
ncbi:MAG: hypothetical protein DRN15_11085 [Thermoprotei archaeon]|nr:MAG: hypothetical protein DRN15_11085 [Thermoprotei archaeon]